MRSGNGRHRRPRQVPALVVTAGVAGSALALPLFAATGANAAETTTWDKVAECESGGTWSADFGSGSYGGLQFTQEQWKNAGGLEFAARPDLASRSQQIAIGERVLASQGPQAWPLCGESSGLTRGGPKATVDPGSPGHSGSVAPSPVRPEESPAPGSLAGAPAPGSTPTSTGHIPGATTTPTAPPKTLPPVPETPLTSGLPVMPPPAPETGGPGTPTGSTGTTAPSVPGGSTLPSGPTTSPSGIPAPVNPAAPSGSTAAAQGETAGAGGKHRGTPAAEAPVTSDTASEPTYTVKSGDNLTAIAKATGVKGGWNALYEANSQVIGHDADLITPGQNLDLSQK
ncbi:transglycosylase family protein [Streptomyces sp. NBC_00536]|uniref:transglycosylase family protein n=1 Tax=Streptomyces sp. NBC_00536 TaxID=2975769 RepID=UPI002E80B196|nr:transglycosylase family protein [Streptomyces sp. NBC_00536]WUC79435.1 transglycosylase family protein [Streptomyces sp. NBC_00536]